MGNFPREINGGSMAILSLYKFTAGCSSPLLLLVFAVSASNLLQQNDASSMINNGMWFPITVGTYSLSGFLHTIRLRVFIGVLASSAHVCVDDKPSMSYRQAYIHNTYVKKLQKKNSSIYFSVLCM